MVKDRFTGYDTEVFEAKRNGLRAQNRNKNVTITLNSSDAS